MEEGKMNINVNFENPRKPISCTAYDDIMGVVSQIQNKQVLYGVDIAIVCGLQHLEELKNMLIQNSQPSPNQHKPDYPESGDEGFWDCYPLEGLSGVDLARHNKAKITLIDMIHEMSQGKISHDILIEPRLRMRTVGDRHLWDLIPKQFKWGRIENGILIWEGTVAELRNCLRIVILKDSYKPSNCISMLKKYSNVEDRERITVKDKGRNKDIPFIEAVKKSLRNNTTTTKGHTSDMDVVVDFLSIAMEKFLKIQ